MATDSLVGGAQGTLVAPAPPSGKVSSFVGGAQGTLVAPAGPYRSSLVGGARGTLAAPAQAIRASKVKVNGSWLPTVTTTYDSATDSWI